MSAGKYLELAVILKAVDQMSGPIRNALGSASSGYSQLLNSQEKAQLNMRKGLNMGAGAVVAIDLLKDLANKYGDVDDAQRDLRISMLKPGGGLDEKLYGKYIGLEKQLSNSYGESQASYIGMIRAMRENRIEGVDILGGIGNADAVLAKVFKTLPEESALFSARMKNDMKVPANEMLKMIDLVARLKQVGVGHTGSETITDLTEFYSKAGLGAVNLGLHGTNDAMELGALGGMFIAKGQDAPSVGTTFRRIFDNIANPKKFKLMNDEAAKFGKHLEFFDKAGKFKGVQNFVAQLSTLQGLSTQKITQILGPAGSAQGMSGDVLKFISMHGQSDYLDFLKRIADQGTLADKLAERMQGQNVEIQKATTAFENLEVNLGKTFNPTVIKATSLTSKFFNALSEFTEGHPLVTKVVAGLALLATGAMALGAAAHFANAAWTTWGAGSVFRWIAGTNIFQASIAGASDLTFSLLSKVLPAMSTIVGVISELGVVGVGSIAAIIAELAYFPYKMYTEHKSDVEAMREYNADIAAHPYEKKYRGLSQAEINDYNNTRHFDPKKTGGYEYKSPFEASSLPGRLNKVTAIVQVNKPVTTTDHAMPKIVYSPTININAATTVTRKTISDTLVEHGNKLMELINKQQHDKLRTAF